MYSSAAKTFRALDLATDFTDFHRKRPMETDLEQRAIEHGSNLIKSD